MSVVGADRKSGKVARAKRKVASTLKSSDENAGGLAADVITPSGRFTNLDAVKLRGGYYTPAPLSAWLAEWGIRSLTDRVLEPSCGDGNLLLAAAQRLLSLGATRELVGRQLQGVELSSAEAHVARTRLTELLSETEPEIVQAGDFFGWRDQSEAVDAGYDVVIGNPPFIRYQAFPEPARSRAMDLMARAGLKANKLTNIWVPFVVAAIEALKPGGRLALVIPAELLQVTYAGQLRRFLTARFQHVGLVSCNELFFEGAEQEVLLLLAEGALEATSPGNDCRVALVERATVEQIVASDPVNLIADADEKHVCGDSEKWLKYFLDAREIEFMRELRSGKSASNLSEFAQVDVGVVTGKNQFFVLRQSELLALGLRRSVVPLVSRSAHLRGAVIDTEEWERLSDVDERVHLLSLTASMPMLTNHEAQYVMWGEEEGFHQGYKCSIRKPWYKVPSAWVPDGFVFRQIYDFPRFVNNECGATSTDTIHRLAVSGCDKADLIASTYTYLTAASAEIEGRSYGGGVLELEPTEAERLLVPSTLGHALSLAEADSVIRAKGMEALLEENARMVLRDGLGLSQRDVKMLKAIWDKMRQRRFSRGKSKVA
jgi:adenine-specific DNA-methyltransferase